MCRFFWPKGAFFSPRYHLCSNGATFHGMLLYINTHIPWHTIQSNGLYTYIKPNEKKYKRTQYTHSDSKQ